MNRFLKKDNLRSNNIFLGNKCSLNIFVLLSAIDNLRIDHLYFSSCLTFLVLDAKSHRANILNVSREPPSPISFWPISNNLHDTTTKSNRRYVFCFNILIDSGELGQYTFCCRIEGEPAFYYCHLDKD